MARARSRDRDERGATRLEGRGTTGRLAAAASSLYVLRFALDFDLRVLPARERRGRGAKKRGERERAAGGCEQKAAAAAEAARRLYFFYVAYYDLAILCTSFLLLMFRCT